MKPTILLIPCLLFLLGKFDPAEAQSITWQQAGDLPLIDLLSGNMFPGLHGTLFLSEGYRSDDLGLTWTQMSIVARDVEMVPGGVILFAVENGILKSTDNGETWSQLSPDLEGQSIDDIIPVNSTTLIARSGKKFFRSDDGGKTWTFKGNFLIEYVIGAGAISGETLFGATEFATEFGSGDEANDSTGVYRSTDGGETWQQTTFTPDLITDGKTMTLRSFYVGMNGTLLVAIQGMEGTGGVYRSGDHGESWASTTLQDVVTHIIGAPDGVLFASAANSGVYRSTDDGRTWSPVNSGLPDPRIFPLAINSDGILFTADAFYRVSRTKQPVVALSSVSDEQSDFTARISPNCTGGRASLSLHTATSGIVRVALLDLLGKEVDIADEGIRGEGEQRLELDLTKFPTGRYYVRVESSGGVRMLPIVLAR